MVQRDRQPRLLFFTVTLLAATFLLLVVWSKMRRVKVVVSNQSTELLEGVVLEFDGGPLQIEQIAAGQEVRFEIRTRKTADLILHCQTADGQEIIQQIAQSVRPGDGGSVLVVFSTSATGFDIKVEQRLQRYPI
ncbi:MAG: hypothetical protein HJJLKODD_00941 [Phycisphaerae bacterium]|nr:hypothetical protein [Phycisphaerae bacterium]